MIKSLKFQIAIAFFIIFLLISSTFSFFQFDQIKKVLVGSFEESLEIEGKNALERFQSDPYTIPTLSSERPIQIWLSNANEWFLFYERDDFPIDVSSLFESVQSSIPIEQPITIELDSLTAFIQKSLINSAEVNSRAVVLVKSNSQLKTELKSIQTRLFRNNIYAALVSLFVAIAISHFLLNPLKRIINKAKSISAGLKMDRLPSSNSSQEVQELASTINQMIERIESSIIKQNKFFDSASHELKTPLANMLAEIDYQLEVQKEHKNSELFLSLKTEVLRLSHLVNDFLLMSQLKSDQLILSKETLRLDDLIYDILERMKYSLGSKQFDFNLQMEGADSSLLVKSDLSKMESIIYNLLSNAFKYSHHVDKIEISLHHLNEELLLSISNKIDKQKLMNHGNKLGLWLSKELALKLGFLLETYEKNEVFEAVLHIPINAHNLQH